MQYNMYTLERESNMLDLNNRGLENIADEEKTPVNPEDTISVPRGRDPDDIKPIESCSSCITLLTFSIGTLAGIGYGLYKAVQYFSE